MNTNFNHYIAPHSSKKLQTLGLLLAQAPGDDSSGRVNSTASFRKIPNNNDTIDPMYTNNSDKNVLCENMPLDAEFRDQIRQHIERDTIEIPVPPGKPVTGYCSIPKDCMVWNENGTMDITNIYTYVKIDSVKRGAHAWAAVLKTGRYPESAEVVLHLCDCKCCRNPEHVCIGTSSENAQQAYARNLIPQNYSGARRGEKNGRAKLTNAQAAEAKWLMANRDVWYGPDIAENHKAEEALAIFFKCPTPSIKYTKDHQSWRGVVPARPEKLPDAISVPPNAKPPLPERGGRMRKYVEEILLSYPISKNKRNFVRDAANKYKCSKQMIRTILQRENYADIRPDIKPVDFSLVGNLLFAPEIVQQIRATHAAYAPRPGLDAALGRYFRCGRSHICNIVAGLTRADVPEDPAAVVIPLEELEFKALTQRGPKHRLSKLTDAQALEILRELQRGVSVSKLALRYNVSHNPIYRIRKGLGYPIAQAKFKAERLTNQDATQ